MVLRHLHLTTHLLHHRQENSLPRRQMVVHHHTRVHNRDHHPATPQRPKMHMQHTGSLIPTTISQCANMSVGHNMATMSTQHNLRSGQRASKRSITNNMLGKQQRPLRATLLPLHRLQRRRRSYLMLSYVVIVPCFICVIFGWCVDTYWSRRQ
jgi:hypothetical protein